jgi:hypothetical protein
LEALDQAMSQNPSAQQITDKMMEAAALREHLEQGAAEITVQFQFLIQKALEACCALDDAGKFENLCMEGDPGDDLKKLCESYQSFATAEATRRASTRPVDQKTAVRQGALNEALSQIKAGPTPKPIGPHDGPL